MSYFLVAFHDDRSNESGTLQGLGFRLERCAGYVTDSARYLVGEVPDQSCWLVTGPASGEMVPEMQRLLHARVPEAVIPLSCAIRTLAETGASLLLWWSDVVDDCRRDLLQTVSDVDDMIRVAFEQQELDGNVCVLFKQ